MDAIFEIAATSTLALLCCDFIPKHASPLIYHIISLFVMTVVFLSASGRMPRTVPEM